MKQKNSSLHNLDMPQLRKQASSLAAQLSQARFAKRKMKSQGGVVTTARMADQLARVLTVIKQKESQIAS